jgi:hypothetical protein
MATEGPSKAGVAAIDRVAALCFEDLNGALVLLQDELLVRFPQNIKIPSLPCAYTRRPPESDWRRRAESISQLQRQIVLGRHKQRVSNDKASIIFAVYCRADTCPIRPKR